MGKSGEAAKTPYSFELANGNPIGFAGLWDAWKDKRGHWLQTFAIVTTEANELMSRVHPRMPVILHPRDYDRWLGREESNNCRSISSGLSTPTKWKCTKLIRKWAMFAITGRN